MKQISVGHGKFAIVDDDDYPYLSRFSWNLNNGHVIRGGVFQKENMMAYFVAKKDKSQRFIFRNRNPLDLRKENVTVADWGTSSAFHRKTVRPTTSKHKGVCWDKRARKWLAYLTVRDSKGKRIKVLWQHCDTEKEAALVRNEKASEVFGELAYQNDVA